MSYWSTVLADSPKVLLKCDEASGNLADSSGNSHGATVSGTALAYQVAGPAAGILYGATFSLGSLATIADHADIDLGNGPFSIEFWLKKASGTYAGDVLIKGSATSGYYVYWSSGNSQRLARPDGFTNISSNADTDTGWHHWVFTRGSAVDGKVWRDATDVSNSNNSATFTDNANDLVIGDPDDAGPGTLAGIAIYKTQLDSTKVSAHYAARTDAGGGLPPRWPLVASQAVARAGAW